MDPINYGGQPTVYVGNLEWSTTLDDLSKFMSQVGEVVSAEVKYHTDSGRAKGWGYAYLLSIMIMFSFSPYCNSLVTYSDYDTAKLAVEKLDMAILNSRRIHVRFDRTTIEAIKGYSVYVGNLPWTVEGMNLLLSIVIPY